MNFWHRSANRGTSSGFSAFNIDSDNGLCTGKSYFTLRPKYNVNGLQVQCVALLTQQLEQLVKAVSRIAIRQFIQHLDHWLIALNIRQVKIIALLNDNILQPGVRSWQTTHSDS